MVLLAPSRPPRSRIASRQNRIAASFDCHCARLPRREPADLVLPLVAEDQDHHLVIDVRVVAQAAYRATARGREHLVGGLSLFCELGQRADFCGSWYCAMYSHPERALVTLVLLLLYIDAAQRAVVASEIAQQREQ